MVMQQSGKWGGASRLYFRFALVGETDINLVWNVPHYIYIYVIYIFVPLGNNSLRANPIQEHGLVKGVFSRFNFSVIT